VVRAKGKRENDLGAPGMRMNFPDSPHYLALRDMAREELPFGTMIYLPCWGYLTPPRAWGRLPP